MVLDVNILRRPDCLRVLTEEGARMAALEGEGFAAGDVRKKPLR